MILQQCNPDPLYYEKIDDNRGELMTKTESLVSGVEIEKDEKESSKSMANKWIFTKHITLKDGRKIYAHNYGLKAFRIPGSRNVNQN